MRPMDQGASHRFSIAGLLFVVTGLGIVFALTPRLYAVSPMSPPWSVLSLIILMFIGAFGPNGYMRPTTQEYNRRPHLPIASLIMAA